MSAPFSKGILLFIILLGFMRPTGLAAATHPVQSLLDSYGRGDPADVVKAAAPLAEAGRPEAQFVLGLFQDIGAGTRIDHQSALRWLEKGAEQGNQPARHLLAWKYETGFGLTAPDPKMSAVWRNKAQTFDETAYARWLPKTDGGFAPNFNRAFLWMIDNAEENSPVMMNLAEAYISVQWTEPDKDQHLQWLERAAGAGEWEAVEMLSVYYDAGLFVAADPEKGLTFRRKAAAAGRPLSQYLLGLQFDEGRGVEKNLGTAVGWYEQAAKQDHVPALQRLIFLRRNGGPGLEPNFKDAVRWAERGRKLGDAECTRHLADLYNRGDGVARNFSKSAELYRDAAAKGEVNAMCMLGWIYHRGELGEPDLTEARRWYRQAADLGNVRAMRELGYLHDEGLGGSSDPAAAFEWYERAARNGDDYAQGRMGKFLLQGRGCTADAEEAINWFRLADKNRPRTDYFPFAGSWSKLGDLSMVVDGLIAVARQETDLWLMDNLILVVSEDPKQKEDFLMKFVQLSESPDLLEAPGILPETCLAILEKNSYDKPVQEHAVELFKRILTADRPQSALQLGRYALAGCRMPRDLERAAQWAKIAATQTPWQGTVLQAVIDCESSDSRERDAGWAIVRKYAAGTDPDALLAVARRCVAGMATAEEFAWVKRYDYLATSLARQCGDVQFSRRFYQFMDHLPPDEDDLQKKIARVLAARKAGADAPTEFVHSVKPVYPADLLEEKISGHVDVQFVVTSEGRTADIKVLDSSEPRFTDPAIAAVRQWRFAPGWKNGRPVNTKVQQRLKFALTPEEPAPKP